MTRMNLLLSVVLSVLSFSSFASAADVARPDGFAGDWKGQGVYILNGDLTQCTGFDMKFAVINETFEFTSGSRVCDKHSEQFITVQMKMNNGRLMIGDMTVGSYDGDFLEASFRAPDGNSFRNWRMTMRRQGDHVIYEESRRMDGETTPLISFAGLLIRSQD